MALSNRRHSGKLKGKFGDQELQKNNNTLLFGPFFLIISVLNYIIERIKCIFHYLFDPKLNKSVEFYPFHTSGEFEPRTKFSYRFFLVSNRFQRLGFGFEYRGLYYFSNGHFSSEDKIHIDNNEVRLYQLGFCFLCSKKSHNLTEPRDEEDLFLINPYMPTIKGKCIYKHPFYYSYFPINPEFKEFTGLPIVNYKGELVSIYDNFRKIEDNTYNILGEIQLWKERDKDLDQELFMNKIHLKVIELKQYDLVIYEIVLRDNNIGYFFKYKNIYYISNAFINEDGYLDLNIPGDDVNNDKFVNLLRDWFYYSKNLNHNISFPENGQEAYLLNLQSDDKVKTCKGVVRFENNFRFWVDFQGSPLRNSIGLPILDKYNEVIGIYGDFKTFNRVNKFGYSILLGDLNLHKDHFLRLVLSNSNSNDILEIKYDSKIFEQIASLYLDQKKNLLNRVILGVDDKEMVENAGNKLCQMLGEDHLDEVLMIRDATIKCTHIKNKKFLIVPIDWIGYSYLNNKDEFPFNNSKSLLVLFQSKSMAFTQDLLIKYYRDSSISRRGYLFKVILNEPILI